MIELLSFRSVQAFAVNFFMDEFATPLVGFIPVIVNTDEIGKRYVFLEMDREVVGELKIHRPPVALKLIKELPLFCGTKPVCVQDHRIQANQRLAALFPPVASTHIGQRSVFGKERLHAAGHKVKGRSRGEYFWRRDWQPV